jgi:hypothetical protein
MLPLRKDEEAEHESVRREPIPTQIPATALCDLKQAGLISAAAC